MLKLGAHESISGGLHQAFDRGESAGCESLQIWVKNSRQWSAPPLDDDAMQQFQEARQRTGIGPVIAHAAYLINIASPKPELYEKSIRSLTEEVERCEALDVPYLVLHPGSHTGAGVEAGLARVAEALGEIHTATPGYRTQILLETTAGQGTNLGAEFEHLAYLLNETAQGERLGICLDTCHVFTAGYELRTPEGYEETMTTFDRVIGLDRLRAIHLNDSKYPFDSRRDRHEHVGKGYLGEESFRHILNDARLNGLPGLLETPKSKDLHEDRENLAVLRALVA